MIQAILTDIEGTTSSLSFVKDVLFPYSRDRLPEFVRAHGHRSDVQPLLAEVRRLAGTPLDHEQLIAQLLCWIDEDKKITPLKALQGMIWEEGFTRGDFQGHIYEDAVRQLRAWHARGLRLFVFSSGSVQAQKLLFRFSAYGDLTPLFSGYFDTTVGAKREPQAYRQIAETINFSPSVTLFLSDIVEELDAAKAAKMKTYWLVRADGATTSSHRQAKTFDEIEL